MISLRIGPKLNGVAAVANVGSGFIKDKYSSKYKHIIICEHMHNGEGNRHSRIVETQ
jgi:hypothetical protein